MKRFKKIIVMLLTVALFIGLIPTAVFAGTYPEYVYDSKNVVGSCRLTAQASTNGVLTDSTGGTVVRTNSAAFFECGGGVWTFKAVPAQGYEFDGWETLLTWQERDWIWKDWKNFSEVNPSRVKGSYPLAVEHIGNRNGNGAFHTDGLNMSVHHVWCSLPMATKIQNVQYNFIAKFKKIPFTLTVNHKVAVSNQNGVFVREDSYPSDPDVTAYKVGDKVKPSMFPYNMPGLSFTGPDDEVTLAAGANVLTANYTMTERVPQPASLVVIHKGVSIDQFDTETEVTLQTDAAIPSFDEDDIVNSADYVSQAGFEGYTYDSSRDVSKDLEPGENTISVYYTKEIYVNQKVDVIVNHIGRTYNSAGTVISETPIAPQEVITDIYYEGVTVQSGLFKKGATLAGYKYDATLDETLVLALPDAETEENPNIINVYYVKKPAPYVPYYPYYPPTVVIEEEETPLAEVTETIEEEPTPLAQTPVPQTSDSNASALLLAIVAIAGAGLFATKLVLKKDEE